jgi:DNA-binding response OmpR family regulator
MFLSGGESAPFIWFSNMLLKIKAMLVMARERRIPLLDLLESCGIEVVSACDCNEARRMLETQPPVQTVLTDRALPDGDWREVLEIVAQGRAYVQVVVCSRLGDHTLLIDVLEQGGYDVLVEPYRREEIRRVLEAAAARSYTCSHQATSKPKAARAAV